MQLTKEALAQRIRELAIQKQNSLAEKQRAHDNTCAQEGAMQQCRAFLAEIEKAEREAEEAEKKAAAEAQAAADEKAAAAAEEYRLAALEEQRLAALAQQGLEDAGYQLATEAEAATGG